ncbi:alpha/beta fold hydrolase [Streptomyces alkaliphilus]|uniref:Alpha/beta fold hydrolase n=1 Tax=Streptomyces alkaliphilus TaxID=1472722 RepID=A0A7W3TFV0_9ACTN|nr:alpha/beta hydrolase [Streptomyces alkaliphilus]MBB0245760.1 alpha/beta fold hydrolase [Streptomyces alkaliphilus]
MSAARTSRALAAALTATALLLTGCTGASDTAPDDALGAPAGHTNDITESTGGLDDVPEDLLPYYEQEITWRDCGVSGYQCATLNAPLDHDAVDPAEDVQLAVSRIRAVGPAEERLGALLVNPGGPGSSAVDFLQNHAGTGFPAEVRARYDIVAVDPRGTGGSEPVECLDDAAMDAFTLVDRTPDDDAEIDALTNALIDFAESCRERSGRLLEHISTTEAARDLDLVRAVLGEERLNYYGASYGTHLGAVYADLFPHRSGRLVLDAGVDPRLDTLTTDLMQAAGFEAALHEFVIDCVGHEDCPILSIDDIADLLDALDAEPLPTGEDRPLTESLATTAIARALYSETVWPRLREALTPAVAVALDIEELRTEDFDEGASATPGAPLLRLADEYHRRDAVGAYGTVNFAFPAIGCLDRPADLTTPEDVLAALDTFEEMAPTFGRDFAWSSLLCGVWPVEATGEPGPVRAAGADPILVIGTTRDPATPYAWSESLADQLESAVLLTLDGDGHGAYGTDGCVDAAVNAHLIEDLQPEPGTTCP